MLDPIGDIHIVLYTILLYPHWVSIVLVIVVVIVLVTEIVCLRSLLYYKNKVAL